MKGVLGRLGVAIDLSIRLIGVLVIIIVAVLFSLTMTKVPTGSTANGRTGQCDVNDFGTGVYYFGCHAEFGHALAIFIQQHPDHPVVTITTDVRIQNTAGYWVVTK